MTELKMHSLNLPKMTKESIQRLFSSFNEMKVLIIGDVMVDAYYWGSVDRISPEAPVPIIAVNKKEARMGGAANVALNIQALGATPILCSVIGKDQDGDEFLNLLDSCQQTDMGILRADDRTTTKKTRIIGNHHQMLRIDEEKIESLSNSTSAEFVAKVQQLINDEDIDVIIFEDYDKGVLNQSIIQEVVKLAKQKNIPTAVDPKKNNFLNFKNVDLFKPNLKELKEGLKLEFDVLDTEQLEAALNQLSGILNNAISFLTLSEHGVYIKTAEESIHVKAHLRDITDVSGAGDTVISVASLCLAARQSIKTIAEVSNLAGGLVCENVGVVPIDKGHLLEESILHLTK